MPLLPKVLNPKNWFKKSYDDLTEINFSELSPFMRLLLYGDCDVSFNVTAAAAYDYYAKVEPVGSSVSLISDAVASLPLAVIEGGDSEVLNVEHEALAVIKEPGAQLDRSSLLAELTTSYLLTGESWLVLSGNPEREPVEAIYVRPYNVDMVGTLPVDGIPNEIKVNDPKDSRNYFKRLVDGEYRFFDLQNLKELVPIIGIVNTADQFRALPVLSSIKKEMDQIAFGNIHNSAMLEGGMRPSGIITPKETITPKQVEEAKVSLRKSLGSAAKAGRPIFVPAQIEKIDMLVNNKDADYLSLVSKAEERIYGYFSIPFPLVSSERMTLSNYEIAQVAFYDYAVSNTFNAIFSKISRILGIRYGIENLKISFNPHGVKALQQRQAERMETLSKAYVLTTNEIRATAGYAPVDGGDKINIPANLIPLGSSLDFVSGGEA